MTRCDVVYVVLAEHSDGDRLERCGQLDCSEHEVQLGWVRADPARLAAYNAQLRRYAAGQQLAGQWEETSLL